MMYTVKRMIAFLLVMVMVFNVMPMSAFASEMKTSEFEGSLEEHASNSKGTKNNRNAGSTANVFIDPTFSYDHRLFIVFENTVWTYQDADNQFYSTQYAVQKLEWDATNNVFIGISPTEYTTVDRRGSAEGKRVYLGTGQYGTGWENDLTANDVAHNAAQCHFFYENESIGNNKTIKVEQSGNTFNVSIGQIPHTASVTNLPTGNGINTYCIVAKVGSAYYVAPFSDISNGKAYFDGYDTIPDEADDIKIVDYNNQSTGQQLYANAALREIHLSDGDYVITGPTPQNNGLDYNFSFTKKIQYQATFSSTEAIAQSQGIYVLAKVNDEPIGYAALVGNDIENLVFKDNSGSNIALYNYDGLSFEIVKYTGSTLSLEALDNSDKKATNGEVLDKFEFSWVLQSKTYHFTATKQTSNVFITLDYPEGGVSLSQTYYVAVGPFDGPYVYKKLSEMPVDGEYGFLADVENVDYYFIALKQANSDAEAGTRTGGSIITLGASDSDTPVTGSINENKTYSARWEKLSEDHFKITLTEKPSHKVIMAAEEGVDTSYLAVAFKSTGIWNTHSDWGQQQFYQFVDFADGTQSFDTMFIPYQQDSEQDYPIGDSIEAYLVEGDSNNQNVLNNNGQESRRIYNGGEYQGKPVNIVTEGDTTTVTIGNPGPAVYTASIKFFGAWDTTETVVSELSGYTVEATEKDDPSKTHTGSITGTGAIILDNGDVYEIADDGWVFKYNGTVTDSITVGDKTYLLPENGPVLQGKDYYIEARAARTYDRISIQYYDAWQTAPSDDVTLESGYTLVATSKDDPEQIYELTINENGTVSLPDNVSGLPAIKNWILKKNNQDAGTDLGKYTIELTPTDYQGSYLFRAIEPSLVSSEIVFDNGDESTELKSGYDYYVVALKSGSPIKYAQFTDSTNPLVFTNLDGNTSDMDQDTYFMIVRLPESTTVTEEAIEEAPGADKVLSSGEMLGLYAFTWDNEPDETTHKYTITATKTGKYPSRIEYNSDVTADTENYYIVAYVDSEAAAYATVPSGNGSVQFTDGTNNVNLPKGTTFKLVYAAGLDNPSLEDLSALSDCTGELDGKNLYIPSNTKGEGDSEAFVFNVSGKIANSIHVVFRNANGDPETPITAPTGYYLRVKVQENKGTPDAPDWQDVGWYLQPITLSDADNRVEITTLAKMDRNALNISSLPAEAKFDFDETKHRINTNDAQAVRLIQIGQTSWINGYSDAANTTNGNIDQSAPEPYTHKGGEQHRDGGWSIVLQKEKPKNYHIRLEFEGAESIADIPSVERDGSLYVRVQIGHKSGGGDTYGLVRVTDDMLKTITEGGKTVVVMDVPIESWTYYNGDPATGETFTGNEDSMSVALVYYPEATSATTVTPATKPAKVMEIGEYINNAKITKYPVKNDPERITVTNAQDPTKDDVYDIVRLKLDNSKLSDYSLEFLLTKYNVITLCKKKNGTGDGNYNDGNHTIGGILVRGDLVAVGNDFTNIGTGEKATSPSAVGGSVPNVNFDIIGGGQSKIHNHDFYIGSENTVYGGGQGDYINGDKKYGHVSYNTYGNTIVNDNFVDWDRLQSNILAQSDAMLSTSTRKVTGDTVYITVGEHVEIDDTVKKVVIIAPAGINWTEAPGTVISSASTGTVHAPEIQLAYGSVLDTSHLAYEEMSAAENGGGMSILFNFPKASEADFRDSPAFGHLLAPRGHIKVLGGNYNGSLVGNEVTSNGEGHLWPYKGGEIVGTKFGLKAKKMVDDDIPIKNFTFEMEKLNADTGLWEHFDTAANIGDTISFKQITFGSQGIYWFRIHELTTDINGNEIEGFQFDDTYYIVRDDITSRFDENDRIVLDHSDKFFTIIDEDGLVIDDPIYTGKYTIDIDKLDEIEILGEQTSKDAIQFENTTLRAGLTIAKYVVSPVPADHSAIYYFNIVLDDTSINGTFSEVTFTDGVATNVAVQGDSSITIEGLPQTVGYEITEVTSSLGEKFTFNPSVPVISGDSIGANGVTATFTNTRRVTSLSGTKEWRDPEGTHNDNGTEITLVLYSKVKGSSGTGTVVSPQPAVVWSEDSYSYSNLPMHNDAGEELEYWVVESPKDHYATTYTNTATGHTDDNTRAYDNGTIINTLTGETELNGTKVWMDGGAQSEETADVTLTLHRTSEGSSEETFSEDQLPGGATLAWDGDNFTITGLPLYDNDNHEYTYSVTGEAASGNVTVSLDNTTKDTQAGTVSLSGSKTTDGAASGHNNAQEITLTLHQQSAKPNTGEVFYTQNSVPNGASLTWTGDNYKYSKLPKYDNEGYEYTYWVTETPVVGFEDPIYDNGANKPNDKALDHGQIINRKTGETSLSGTKTWKDAGRTHDNETEITLALHRVSAKGGSLEDVDVADPITFAWEGDTYTYDHLPQYDDEGYEYTYSVTEETYPEGFTSSVDGNNLINTRTGLVNLSGTKVWLDGGANHTNSSDVALTLYQQSAKSGSSIVTYTGSSLPAEASLGWNGNNYTYSNLPKYDSDGYEYSYWVTEAPVNGYAGPQYNNGTDQPTDKALNGGQIINQKTGKTNLNGTKTWVDGGLTHNNANDVTLTLTRVSAKAGSTAETVDAEPTWTEDGDYKYENLDKYDADGFMYTYWVVETQVDGYAAPEYANTAEGYTTETEKAYDGATITNRITGETELCGTKTWIDGDKDHDNAEDVTLTLKRISTKSGATEETVDAESTWTEDGDYKYENLDKYDADGFLYTYWVVETQVDGYAAPEYANTAEGYTTETEKAYDGATITNRITGETELGGCKVWVDGDASHTNADDVTLTLKRISAKTGATEETVDAEPAWTDGAYKYENLDKYDAEGFLYTYWVVETQVDGYAAPEYVNTAEGYTTETEKAYDGATITNRITGETELGGSKVWVDGDARHTNADDVTLTLKRISAKTGATEETVNAEPDWDEGAYKYENLDKYDAEGFLYTYWVIETQVDGYAAPEYANTAEGYTTETEKAYDGATITNRITGETELGGSKAWVDGNASHTNADDVTLTLKRISAKTGATEETVDAEPAWTDGAYKYENLDKYDAEGFLYTYWVIETQVDGYAAPEYVNTAEGYTTETEKAYDGATITNRITGETELGGSKVWVDVNSDTTHTNATEVALTLHQLSAKPEAAETTYTGTDLPGDESTFAWSGSSYKYSKLPKYDDEGYAYTYWVTETQISGYAAPEYVNTADGYTTETEKAYDGATITNRRILTSAMVQKIWRDDDNRDGLRPASLQLELLADNVGTGKYVYLNEGNHWADKIDDLPKYNGSQEIEYSWQEPDVVNYELTSTVKTGTLTILTNEHPPVKTQVDVKKVWAGGGTDDSHPGSVVVQLYADGKACRDAVTLDEANGWKHSWTDLDENVCEAGASRKIKYTVAETEIPEGYTAKITGNASTGFVITNTKETGHLVIEKEFDIQEPEPELTEEEEVTTDITVTKIWDDNNDKDGNRPKSITVHLFAGGEEVREATLTEATDWNHTFKNLPKFVKGKPIHYSITEDPVEWYTTEISGFTIRNKYIPETVNLVVIKSWDDNNYVNRPTSVRMTLSNGASVILSDANGWTGVVSGLPTRVNGQPVTYTWTEQSIIGYQLESVVTQGNVTIFTNKLWKEPDDEPGGETKKPGETIIFMDEYDTPLGIDVMINHVGDCFD